MEGAEHFVKTTLIFLQINQACGEMKRKTKWERNKKHFVQNGAAQMCFVTAKSACDNQIWMQQFVE